MKEYSKGFDIEQALIIDGGIAVFVGDLLPHLEVSSDAPIGSVYYRSDGTTWQKIADAVPATDWELGATGTIAECLPVGLDGGGEVHIQAIGGQLEVGLDGGGSATIDLVECP